MKSFHCLSSFVAAIAFVATASASTIEFQTLIADTPEASAEFGAAVAMSGNTAIVGAPQQGDGDVGAAYIFRDDGFGNWNQISKLMTVDPNVFGFGHSVSIRGNTAIVGARNRSAYIFREEDDGNWNQIAALNSTGLNDISFGRSVSISDGVAIVGGRSAAYVYRELTVGNWARIAELNNQFDGLPGNFGQSVGISDDIAIVGAPDHPTAGGSGTAYVFQDNGSNVWNLVAKLISIDASPGDQFGGSVAIAGTRIVVGAEMVDGEQIGSGAAYVFEQSGGSWTQVEKLEADQGHTGSGFRFGNSVALSDDAIVVGAVENTPDHLPDGGVYAFKQDGSGNWQQFVEFIRSEPRDGSGFGRTVGTNGNVVIAGDTLGNEFPGHFFSGAAYLFDVPDVPIPRVPEPSIWVQVMLVGITLFFGRYRL